MVSPTAFRKAALSFPGSVELPHFEKTSFRAGKKIFATLNSDTKEVVVKLSPVDQSVFCDINREMIYPAKGAWGKQGWTVISLKKVNKPILIEVLKKSFTEVTKAVSSQRKK